jgi:uncharacterized protein YbjT (DUF2867 family)
MQMTTIPSGKPVLVVGSTGYIGGRLVPRLLQAGYRVRALARSPKKLQGRQWAEDPHLQIVQGDVLDRASLTAAAAGCGVAYYLVHSMDSEVADFALTDRAAAENMAHAADAAGLERLIYLGGLGEEADELSDHLSSRAEVGGILRAGRVPVTVLRAAMIIGSGSASFEILRYLVERLPVMITPRWVNTPCQPIGVRNVLNYLVGCLRVPETVGQTFDIGQEEIVTYRRLMEIYAEEAGLRKRLILPVRVLTPRLSSLWIHLVMPVPVAIARPLVEGLRNRVVCRDQRIRELIPQELLDCRQAIRRALDRERQQQVESSWTDAGLIPPAEWSIPGDPAWAGGTVFEDARRVVLAGRPEQVWPAVVRIGGSTGWYAADRLWQLRGFLDRLVGGVGLTRGRRSAEDLRPGDALDFWRVVAVDRPRVLLLVAEMKLPGKAVLELRLEETEEGMTELRQTARFLPFGLAGILYWYGISPFHKVVFDGMLKGIAAAAGTAMVAGPERLHGERRR